MMNHRTHRVAATLAAIVASAGMTAVAQVYTPGGSSSTYVPPSYQQQPYQQQPYYQQNPQPVYNPPVYNQPPQLGLTSPSQAQPIGMPQLSDQQIADLTSSIALFPDPLVATMLPAATYPEEIASASRWLSQHPNPDELSIQSLPFEPPVKTLLHYPTVLSMMSDHLDWTQALGAAFVYQSNDVLNSIQRWRFTAQQNGALMSTPQQQVIAADGMIQILPAQPQTVYVPVYDPTVVYAPAAYPRRDVIRFDVGGRGGGWLDDDVDWRRHVIAVPTQPYWERHDWDPHHPDRYNPLVVRDTRDRGRVVERRDQDVDRRAFVRQSFKPNVPDQVRVPNAHDKVITLSRPQDRDARTSNREVRPSERVDPNQGRDKFEVQNHGREVLEQNRYAREQR